MDYLLAIDGGGSKTEFALTDPEGTIIRSVTIPKGTNPWKYDDFREVEVILKDGLDQLDIPESVIGCALGISGCHGKSQYADQFENILRQYIKTAPFLLTGDILPSFKAVSDATSGIVAINGSGSSITLLYDDGSSYVFDGAGIGGRDLAITVVMSAHEGYYSQATNQWIEDVVGETLLRTDLSTLYKNPKIYTVTKELARLDPNHPVRQELNPFLYSIAVRWAVKLWGASLKFRNSAGLSTKSIVPIVLNGSVWNFDVIREKTIELLDKADANLQLLHEPKRTPLSGAIKLAQALVK